MAEPAVPEWDMLFAGPVGQEIKRRVFAYDAVRKLHHKQTRYMIQGYDDRSWDSEESAREWDDEGWKTGKPLDTFDVCAECARVEWVSVEQQTDGEGSMGITSDWPCPTAKALGLS